MKLSKKEKDLLKGLENFGLTHEQYLWNEEDDDVLAGLIEKIFKEEKDVKPKSVIPEGLPTAGYLIYGVGHFRYFHKVDAETKEEALDKYRCFLKSIEKLHDIEIIPICTEAQALYDASDWLNEEFDD